MAVYDAISRGVAQALGLFAPRLARSWLRERARLRATCAGYAGARRDGPNGGYETFTLVMLKVLQYCR